VTEQEKQTRRARRTREQARQALPTSNAAKAEAEGSAEPRGGEAIKDRNKRLRDEAARKRASKRRNRAVEATEGLDASERVDDALTRSAHAATNFVKKNASWLQWVFLAGAAGSIAYLIVDYRAGLGIEKESHVLMEAVAAQQGRIADNDFWRSPDPNLIDPRPEFASEEARLDAAEQRFRAAIDGTTKKGPQLFAHLGLAGVLFDRGKYADARAAYDDAARLAETTALPEARGRAIEGSALSLEAEGKRDEALKRFADLAEVQGFGHLGRYHQARLWHAQGESQKALETLTKVREALVKDAGPQGRPGFLQASVEELMRTIDPSAVPAPGGQGITPEQLEQLQRQLEEFQRRQQELPPAPAPEDAVPEDAVPEDTTPSDAAPEGASEDDGSAPPAEEAPQGAAPPPAAPPVKAPPAKTSAPARQAPPPQAPPAQPAAPPAAPEPPAAPAPTAPSPAAPEGPPAEGTP